MKRKIIWPSDRDDTDHEVFSEDIAQRAISLGHKIKMARLSVGLDQRELAISLGYNGKNPRIIISNVERGKQQLSKNKIIECEKILNFKSGALAKDWLELDQMKKSICIERKQTAHYLDPNAVDRVEKSLCKNTSIGIKLSLLGELGKIAKSENRKINPIIIEAIEYWLAHTRGAT